MPNETVLSPTILADAYNKRELTGGQYGSKVVQLWMNSNTYSQVRKHCRDVLEVPETDEIVTELNQENLGKIWGVPIRTTPTIPDNSLLVISEKDAPFEPRQVPDESMLFRY